MVTWPCGSSVEDLCRRLSLIYVCSRLYCQAEEVDLVGVYWLMFHETGLALVLI